MDTILQASTVRQIRNILTQAPTDLDGAFQSSVERIHARSKGQREMAFRLINWILCADRPLSYDEIKHAFAVQPDATNLDDEDFVSLPSLLRSCVGLVILDQDSQTLRMVHATALEFFERRVDVRIIHTDIATTSLAYLCLDTFKSGACQNTYDMKARLRAFPFLDYASKYWTRHGRAAGVGSQSLTSISVLLQHEGLRSTAFQALQYRHDIVDSELSEKVFESLPKGQSTLHLAALWCLEVTVKRLANSQSVCATDSHSWTPLHWASSNGHEKIVSFLLDAGADMESQDSAGWSALFWASFRGHATALRLLLGKGTNHLLQDKGGWTALHWAVSAGRENTVKILLDHHNSHEGTIRHVVLPASIAKDSATPLHLPTEARDTNLYDLLTQASVMEQNSAVNPWWQSGEFDPPISNVWAFLIKFDYGNDESHFSHFTSDSSWSSRISSLRWRSSRRTGAADESQWNARLLHTSIKDEQFLVAKLLITSGADVNQTILGRTALHVAACRKDASYTRLLLEHGADSSKVDRFGQTAFHLAVSNGFVEVSHVLLEAGANGDVFGDSRLLFRCQ